VISDGGRRKICVRVGEVWGGGAFLRFIYTAALGQIHTFHAVSMQFPCHATNMAF
jgi:hypothetical protein